MHLLEITFLLLWPLLSAPASVLPLSLYIRQLMGMDSTWVSNPGKGLEVPDLLSPELQPKTWGSGHAWSL